MADVNVLAVTVTSTVPTAPAGETAVICVGEFTVTDAAATDPKRTVELLMNPVPVMTTVVPPRREPLAGDSPVTVGVAAV
jgi:hypothetical protein